MNCKAKLLNPSADFQFSSDLSNMSIYSRSFASCGAVVSIAILPNTLTSEAKCVMSLYCFICM